MSKFVIQGGKPLNGEVIIAGSKNAVLPLITASMLVPKVRLKNVPRIGDVFAQLSIFEYLGGKVEWTGEHELLLESHGIQNKLITDEARKLRTSILFAGAFLARFGKISLPYPGGDRIGARSLDAHINSFKALGVEVVEDELLHFTASKHPGGEFIMDEPSVTATENLLIYAAGINEPVIMHSVATEPHVQSLVRFFQKAGVQIEGFGTDTLKVRGSITAKEVEFEVIPDDIEVASFVAATAATHGDVKILGVHEESLTALKLFMNKTGVNYKFDGNVLHIMPPNGPYTAVKLQSGLYPKLASDFLPPLAVLATQAEGTSMVHDWLFEGRQSYIGELYKMGANTVVMDPHRALIIGPTHLYGCEVTSYDIRAGMALIVAGLVAEGETVISGVDHIDRGYENIEGRLQKLDADIKRVGQQQ